MKSALHVQVDLSCVDFSLCSLHHSSHSHCHHHCHHFSPRNASFMLGVPYPSLCNLPPPPHRCFLSMIHFPRQYTNCMNNTQHTHNTHTQHKTTHKTHTHKCINKKQKQYVNTVTTGNGITKNKISRTLKDRQPDLVHA